MKLAIFAAAVAAAAISVPASAVTYITALQGSGNNGQITADDVNSGLYLSPSVNVAAPTGSDKTVNSYYTFTLGAKTMLNGTVNAGTFTSSAPNAVQFSNVTLYDAACTSSSDCSNLNAATPKTALTVGMGGSNGSTSINYAPVTLDAGKYTILVSGTNNAKTSIGSSISFTAPVPEAATWAMMLVGFGGVGGALRSSRRKVSFA